MSDPRETWPIWTGAELGERALGLYRNGLPRGYSTGWSAIDKLYRPTSAQLTVVTGIPGSGKSSWLDSLTLNLAKLHGWNFAFYSPENWPVERHLAMLAGRYLCKPVSPGPTERASEEEFLGALEWLTARYRWLRPSAAADPLTLIDTAIEWRPRITQPFGIVLDPWNALEHLRPQQQSETEYVGATLTGIIERVREHDVHVWVVAHPQKLQRENGKRPVPSPYDIAGSAHWYNRADNCLTIHRDQAEGTSAVEVHVQKIRFADSGQLGIAELEFDRITRTYRDPVKVSADAYERARYGID